MRKASGFKTRKSDKQVFPIFFRTKNPLKNSAFQTMSRVRKATKSRFAGVNPLLVEQEPSLPKYKSTNGVSVELPKVYQKALKEAIAARMQLEKVKAQRAPLYKQKGPLEHYWREKGEAFRREVKAFPRKMMEPYSKGHESWPKDRLERKRLLIEATPKEYKPKSPAEIEREKARKTMKYWKKHPGISREEAESESARPIKTREIRETFSKIKGGLSRLVGAAGPKKKETPIKELENIEEPKEELELEE